MRARFVGPDGLSFFTEIAERPDVISRFVDEPDDFESLVSLTSAGSMPFVQTRRIEHYRREYWYIPIGPLACPTYRGIDRFGEPRVFDVVYRCEGP